MRLNLTKKIKSMAMISLAVLFAFTACDKDDDATKNDNPLIFNDQTFSWNDYAELWYYYDDQYYDMNMFTGTLRVDHARLIGIGNWLNIEFYTSASGILSPGYYILTDSGDEGTCSVDLSLDVNANGEYPITGSYTNFISGNVTIEGSGNTYTVTLDVTDDEGNNMKGTFNSVFANVSVD